MLALRLRGENIREMNLTREGFAHGRRGSLSMSVFPQSAVSDEEHPFTISSAPGESSLSLTVKNLGNFTKSLNNLKPESQVLIDGPMGTSFLILRAPNR